MQILEGGKEIQIILFIYLKYINNIICKNYKIN